jgi:hypothetical protein
MLYRVDPSGTVADLSAAVGRITSSLPADAVVTSTTYLATKADVNTIAQLYVPILLAFAVFALLAAAFTIANVVSGIVLPGYRDIGVMKAVGFTPRQVTTILVAQILVPVTIGAVAGVIVGTVVKSTGGRADRSVVWAAGRVRAVSIGRRRRPLGQHRRRAAGGHRSQRSMRDGSVPLPRSPGGPHRPATATAVACDGSDSDSRSPFPRLGVAAGVAHPIPRHDDSRCPGRRRRRSDLRDGHEPVTPAGHEPARSRADQSGESSCWTRR